MKNLERFGVQELNAKEIRETEGGGLLYDWLVGEAIDAVVDFIGYDNEGYGRRMYETGSPGGHK
jgi:hypothetical protein